MEITETQSRWRRMVIPLLFLLLSCSCDGRSFHNETNLVWLSIDGLHHNSLGCFGSPDPGVPSIERLADSSFVFCNAFSQTSDLYGSHTSMATSLYPAVIPHPPDNNGFLPENAYTLAEILRFHEFRTAAFTGGERLIEGNRIARGFDVFIPSPVNGPNSIYDSIEKAEGWLARNRTGNSRFFLFIQGCLNRSRNTSNGRAVFAADEEQLRELDRRIKHLTRILEDPEYAKSTHIFLFAARGYRIDSGSNPVPEISNRELDQLLKVPFIINSPFIDKKIEIREIVELLDIMPTALELLSLTPPTRISGSPLAALSGGTLSPAVSRDSGPASYAVSQDGKLGLSIRSRTARLTYGGKLPLAEIPGPARENVNIHFEETATDVHISGVKSTEEQFESLWISLLNWEKNLAVLSPADSLLRGAGSGEARTRMLKKGYF